VIIGQRCVRVRSVLFGSALVLGLVSGCTYSTRYPPDLRYPPRSDLLVVVKPAPMPRQLPPPGAMDKHIKEAVEADPNAKAGAVDPNAVDANDRKAIRAALQEVFGTPADPRIEPPEEAADDEAKERRNLFVKELQVWRAGSDLRGIDAVTFTDAAGSDGKVTDKELGDLELTSADLAKGSRLYRRHCLHCHGVNGDGRGPTGPWLHPHPRDYRQGLFKFISSSLKLKARKPRRADLHRVLMHGIDGTSMPSFSLLPEDEIRALASYVIHLSIRGETEFTLLKARAGKAFLHGLEEGDLRGQAYSTAASLFVQWAAANAGKVDTPPAPFPDELVLEGKLEPEVRGKREAAMKTSLTNGHAVFVKNCLSCHDDYGRQPAYRYTDWGTLVKPRNLTEGVYRGGRRPIDIYWRVSGGIPGTPMSTHNKEAGGPLDGKELWDVVNFVQALPYPKMLPPDVRKAIYGASETKAAEDRKHASR